MSDHTSSLVSAISTSRARLFAAPRAGMFALAVVGVLGAWLLSRLKASRPTPAPLEPAQAG
ncbi:hypothetical protein TZ03_22745 [Pseudomonas sp. 10-1B]|uniref:hypothetical protein n=1 Tax=Pseudomonas sp. 10-1B TaxID=1546029 RepID=UPI00061F693D|nr:hypothetical protein [Pseudomonas sp. 10-1B]KIY38418.1 hypothetical protein TZ03_22745 [Pseudomonas sp. 10-1B]